LLDVVEVEIATDRCLYINRDPDASGVGQVTITEIAKDLRGNWLAIECETMADLVDESARGSRVVGRRDERRKERSGHR
jgi:hypothetical protein